MSALFTLSKTERLKSRKAIGLLFKEGLSVYKYPILIYFRHNERETQAGFSVPKKHFKKAVKRNLLKRRMKEGYRLNKHYVANLQMDIMIIYTAKKEEPFAKIETSIIQLLSNLSERKEIASS